MIALLDLSSSGYITSVEYCHNPSQVNTGTGGVSVIFIDLKFKSNIRFNLYFDAITKSV